MKKLDEERLEYITAEVEKVIRQLEKDNLNLTIKGIVHLVINILEEKRSKK